MTMKNILGLIEKYELSESPVGRLHALYVLEAFGGITENLVLQVLQDPHPQLRKRGIQFAENYPNLLPHIIEMVDDQDTDVLFQAALSLGYFRGKQVDQALEQLLAKYPEDPWFQKAIQSRMKIFESPD